MAEYIVKSKLPGIELPNISVGEFFNEKLNAIIAKNPSKIALIDAKTGTKLTHLQYTEQAKKVATSLLENGIEASDLAMFFSENSLEYFTLTLAMAYLGLPVTPNKPSNGAYETIQQLNDCKATILMLSKAMLPVIEQIFKNGQNAQLIEQLKLIIVMDSESVPENLSIFSKVVTFKQLNSSVLLKMIPYFEVANPAVDPYAIVYTSGSTGLPKGAILSHRSYISSILSSLQATCFSNHTSEIALFACPFGHISGTYFSGVFLLSEMQLVVIGTMVPNLLYESLQKYQVSYALISFIFGTHMLANETYDLSSIKAIITSGGKFYENVARGLIDKYNWKFYEIYGATEFMGSVFNNDSWESGNLGSPLPNTEMKIIDIETGSSLPANENGEICFKGPSCFVKYLNNDNATRATIDKDGWYRSGDVGYYNDNGCLFLTDRLKELIKYKSWSVAPAEIEELIQRHEAVAGSCVVGVKHATEHAHLRAYVQLKEGKTATEKEIMQLVKDNMGYMKRLNGGVVFIKEIPRISVGKVDRKYFLQLIKDELLTEKAPE